MKIPLATLMGMASIQPRMTSPIPRNIFAIVSAIAVAANKTLLITVDQSFQF